MSYHLKNYAKSHKNNLLAQKSVMDNIDEKMEKMDIRPNGLKEISNGTYGFGYSGGMFPKFMNGPFGTIDRPLPNTQEKMAIFDGPKYNSMLGQFPSYNEDTFIARSRYSFVPMYGTNYGPNGYTNIPTAPAFTKKQ